MKQYHTGMECIKHATAGNCIHLPVLAGLVLSSIFLFGNCDDPGKTIVPLLINSSVAYGTLGQDGRIYNGSGNFTAAHNGTGQYQITIDGYVCNFMDIRVDATVLMNGQHGYASWSTAVGDLLIYTYNDAGTLSDRAFSFTVSRN